MQNINLNPKGGTELMFDGLIKHCGSQWLDYVNIHFISPINYQIIKNSKKDVLWCHLNTDNENVQGLLNEHIKYQFDYFIFISHDQCNKFISKFNIQRSKCTVIKNAIEEIPYIKKLNNGKIKLVYTSMPWRGLEVLLDAVEKLNRNDFTLDVYSSLEIYGKEYHNSNIHQYQKLFDRAKNQKNVIYHGYKPNFVVKDAVNMAHIFSYPNIFEETSCISAIEAGAAGCRIITTNYGALPETCAEFAEYVQINDNLGELAYNYAIALDETLDNYWSKENQEFIDLQRKYFNNKYSWNKRKEEWNKFFARIKQSMPTEITPTHPLIIPSNNPNIRRINATSITKISTVDQPKQNFDVIAPIVPAHSPRKENISSDIGSTQQIIYPSDLDVIPTTVPNLNKPKRKVLIGTPCLDGRLEVWYAQSLIDTIKLGQSYNTEVAHIWVCYDSLLQRARNDLMFYAITGGFDDLIMIDSDIQWNPQWVFDLLSYNVDVVGGTYRKKGEAEIYVCKHLTPETPVYNNEGLLKVDGLGTGFLRFNRKSMEFLWNNSTPYFHDSKDNRWVFNVVVQNNDILSEDLYVCQKLKEAGFDIWLDTKMTCDHIGMKKYSGDFKNWFDNLLKTNSKLEEKSFQTTSNIDENKEILQNQRHRRFNIS